MDGVALYGAAIRRLSIAVNPERAVSIGNALRQFVTRASGPVNDSQTGIFGRQITLDLLSKLGDFDGRESACRPLGAEAGIGGLNGAVIAAPISAR